jgi:hypothetical protein
MSSTDAVIRTTRQPLLDTLNATLRETRAGGARIVLVRGEPRSGRTALLEVFARTAVSKRWRRPRVLLLQPTPDEAYRPVVHAALASSPGLYRRLGGEQQARELAVEWVGAIPAIGDLLAAISLTADALRRGPGRAGLPALALRDENIEAIWLRARRRPLVLCIDDADRMSDTDAERLAPLVAEAPPDVRLLVVATCAPGLLGSDSPLHELPRALPPQQLHMLELTGLATADIELLLDVMFPGTRHTDGFAQWLADFTDGHAGRLTDLLDRARREGALHDRHGAWQVDTDALTPIAQALAYAADFTRVDDATRNLLRSASALAEPFAALDLARLVQHDPLEVEDRLAIAERAQIVVYTGDTAVGDAATSTFRFASRALRRACHEE